MYPPPRVTLNPSAAVTSVPLGQVVVSYWFNGPEDLKDPSVPQQGAAAAELAGAQFRLACSDATPAVGERRDARTLGRREGARD